ncbi:MAG: ADP-ribosylglycohydrolase family protein [Clostridia bacterium]|nr:ADP-ribosylglycohydrolase family protein [Clostridia bacterium]
MAVSDMICKLRQGANLSQEKFAELFGVSRQSVQKWENGDSLPELEKLIKISKYFNVSIDSIVTDSDSRENHEINFNKKIKPNYENVDSGNSYAENLMTEYCQSIEEGLDIERYEEIFKAVSGLPKGEAKEKFGDILFDIVLNSKFKENYKYVEPSELDKIKLLRKNNAAELGAVDKVKLKDKIYGAWMGRICGCLLGKTVEGIRTDELVPFLKETDNYPMHRYILHSDLNDEILKKYKYDFENKCYADTVDGMPVDDDTNYVVLSQEIIEKYGKDFTPNDVSRAWITMQGKNAYFTAEQVAFCNFIQGFEPPKSAIYKNPYREWIGAQIRGDYFGYINPGNPEFAAEMAFRDASISHIKNGIYGEMFASAMIAAAACTDDIKEIILSGLAQIPHTSRLHEAISDVLNGFENGVSQEDCFADIHRRYDEYSAHGWCHTISNAMIVAASLLYGNSDYGKSICMAVETGFDTDCNGATVGSVLGMAMGTAGIPEKWTKPINDTLHTSIFGVGTVKISERVEMTMKHID